MNIQQMRYAVEIAATGSITKAAKNLFMGQPNLSKSMKELEAEIGITLFVRTPRGVVATANGEAFLGYARSILEQMDTLKALYTPKEQSVQALHVSAPRASYIAHVFSQYLNTLPQNTSTRYRETNSSAVMEDVAAGNSNIGVIRFPVQHLALVEKNLQERGLAMRTLWEYAMVVLMHEDHPLAALPEIPHRLLGEFLEIVHGDWTPLSPTQDGTKKGKKNCIAVFDRGSQFDILRHVKGSYLWVSPIPFSLLAREGLVQKQCVSGTRYYDVVVYRESHTFTEVESGLIDALESEIADLCAFA